MTQDREDLGMSTNLLYGYRADWLTEQAGNQALYSVPSPALDIADNTPTAQTGQWGYPMISLHETAESLLDTLLPYQTHNPSDGIPEATLPAGTLLTRNADRANSLQVLSETLGVDLTQPEGRFALVQLRREDGQATHNSSQMDTLIHPNPVRIPEALGVRKSFRQAMSGLKRAQAAGYSPDDIGQQDAQLYLDLFAEQGSHYISKITYGDVIFQVLAMPKHRFERVQKKYTGREHQLSGPDTYYFRQFTSAYSPEDGPYGYVETHGKILSFSQSPQLANTLEAGHWQENTFAETDSIFALFQEEGPLNWQGLQERFTDVTHIRTYLTTLTLVMEHSRKQAFKRIFKAAAIQLFGASVQPHFATYQEYDPKGQLDGQELPGFLSNIATPVINTYKAALDLTNLRFVAPQEVREFTLFSNHIYHQAQAKVDLPGSDILLCGQLFSLETDSHTTVIEVSDQAFGSLAIYAQHFYGGLLIQSETNRFTMVDGLRYESIPDGPDGRRYVKITDDIRRVPSPDLLERIASNLHFSFTFTEGSLNLASYDSDPPLAQFFRQSLIWISQIIPADTTDEALLDLRVRALDLAYIGQDHTLGSFVPILQADDYQKQVDAILSFIHQIEQTIDRYHQDIETRKTRELIIDVGKSLNENIIQSGKLLAGYIEASIQQQAALATYYDEIITTKKQEQKQQEGTVNDLQKQLKDQQFEVNEAVRDYQEAIQNYHVKEAIKFGITVATDLFSLGKAIAEPIKAGSTALELAKVAITVQQFITIVKATYQVYKDVNSTVDHIKKAQGPFDKVTDTLTANLGWEELSLKFNDVLDSGPSAPDVKGAKVALSNAFKIMVLRGKALTGAEARLQQTAREVYEHHRKKRLVNEQIDRMKKLNTDLNPADIKDLDRSRIDLIGLTGSLAMIRSQMLSILSRAFQTKDQTLQYTELQLPTRIDSFDTLGIQKALATQSTRTIQAKTKWKQLQTTTTTPIEVAVEIPGASLLNGQTYDFHIQPDIPQFYKYVHTRVLKVIARVEGVAYTDSGSYLLNVAYKGRPFIDRSYDREQVIFHTQSRQRTYEYQVADNKPLFADDGKSWSDGVTEITPFSTWEIRLPKSNTNRGLTFADTKVKVLFSFVLQARIQDARERLLQQMANPVGLLTTKSSPSIGELRKNMSGKSVLNNWDVVFSMRLDKINDSLKAQYEELKENTDYGGQIQSATKSKMPDMGQLKVYALKQFKMTYGYPQLKFLINDGTNGEVHMQILEGAMDQGMQYLGEVTDENRKSLEFIAGMYCPDGSCAVEEVEIDGNPMLQLVFFNDQESIGPNATLEAIIPFSKVKGLVEGQENILSVILDMSEGTFKARNMEIEMDDEASLAFSEAVKAYFVNNPVYFIINSLDLRSISTLDDLRPHQFLFKPFRSQLGNDMLMIFIQTNQRAAFDYTQTYISTDVPDPIPEGSDCSLMINSRIFFDGVLPDSINEGWSLEGIEPEERNKAWRAEFTNAEVNATVDLSGLNHTKQVNHGAFVELVRYTYRPKAASTTWPLRKLSLYPGGDSLNIVYEQTEAFQYYEKACRTAGFVEKCSEKEFATDITMTIDHKLPLKIDGEGREQRIEIKFYNKEDEDNDNETEQRMVIDVRVSGGGSCSSDDLQSKVKRELEKKLPKQINEKTKMNIENISVFALKNLLFPSKNFIKLEDVFLPGDLLIVGKFTKD